MFLEADEMAVDKVDWRLMLTGDRSARLRLRSALKDLEIYCHIFVVDDDSKYEVVTVRQAEGAGVLDGVKIQSWSTY